MGLHGSIPCVVGELLPLMKRYFLRFFNLNLRVRQRMLFQIKGYLSSVEATSDICGQ